ncbi:DUF2325 domain-containing protein [Roseateles noduli]|uniref:DUF2325 domain-containing protein n=1 Tax=Roseateles noduli TaxID=2052484 RepID=UPI003D65E069
MLGEGIDSACQTGCISHDAYWRVKDHCKRHNKKCAHIESPSASGMRRALGSLSGAETEDTAAHQTARGL